MCVNAMMPVAAAPIPMRGGPKFEAERTPGVLHRWWQLKFENRQAHFIERVNSSLGKDQTHRRKDDSSSQGEAPNPLSYWPLLCSLVEPPYDNVTDIIGFFDAYPN